MTAKTIKRRITSVKGTQQIMKAMNLVANSKLVKAKENLNAARPLFTETKRIIENLKKHEEVTDSIYLKPREIKNSAFVVMTSDRGLCGGYNVNISKETLTLIEREGKNEKIISVGLKGWEYFKRRKKNIVQRFVGIVETAFYEDAETISKLLTSLYTSGEVDEVYIAYTRFESVISQVPCIERILPIEDSAVDIKKDDNMKYEPSLNVFLENAIPMYVNSLVYGAMVESVTCENAARMVSMDSACNNAGEIIEDLTLMYNRIRQDAITQEINEIVNGANAQK